MKSIIVTAVDKQSGKAYDVEIPEDLDVSKLIDDLIQTFAGIDPNLSRDVSSTELYCYRLGRNLRESKSLYEEGVWNGDVIYIV